MALNTQRVKDALNRTGQDMIQTAENIGFGRPIKDNPQAVKLIRLVGSLTLISVAHELAAAMMVGTLEPDRASDVIHDVVNDFTVE